MAKQKVPDVFEQGFNAAQANGDREAPEAIQDMGDDAVETWLTGYDEWVRQNEAIVPPDEQPAPAETPTPGPQLTPRRTMVRLEVELDDHELAKLAQRLVSNHDDQADVEHAAKEARETFKGKLAALEEEAIAMRTAVSTRKGWRDVEADEFLIFEGRKVVTKRADTGEVISTRDASDDEVKASKVQTEIPGTEAADNVRDFFDSCLTADPGDDLARAWEKGTQAYHRGNASTQNPYDPTTLRAKRWASAFQSASDQHNAELDAAADAISAEIVEASRPAKNCVKCGAGIDKPRFEPGEEELCPKCFES